MALASKKKIFDGKYEIVSIVGRGSRSVVYFARNIVDDNADVALKVLIDNKKDKTPNHERLRHEALAMVSSYHQFVVRLDDFHSIDNLCYLAMEYAPEGDLRKYISRQEKPLSPEQAEIFFTQSAEALDYIHKVGIIHRDIKPDNILVVDSKNVRIADFGVALLPGDTTAPYELRNAVGTMDYMAPEVLEGIDYNQKSDIYALGVSFYEMISGKHPFANAPLAQQLEVREDKSLKPITSIVSGLEPYLAEAIMRCMAYDQKDRFSSARELVQHLKGKRISSGKSDGATTTEEAKKSEKVVDPFGGFGQDIEETEEKTADNLEGRGVEGSESKEAQQSPETKSDPSQTTDEPKDIPAEDKDMDAATASESSELPLRDSRASRTPTLHMTKDDAEAIRRSTEETLLADNYESYRVRSFGIFVATILISALVVILGWSLFHRTAETETTDTQVVDNSIPTYEGEPLQFPSLPKGIFSGTASGIIAGKSVPLTIISFPDREEIAVIVGVAGWIPAIVHVDAKNTSVRVSSNGLIFSLEGTPSDNSIQGTVENLVDGTSGIFSLAAKNS